MASEAPFPTTRRVSAGIVAPDFAPGAPSVVTFDETGILSIEAEPNVSDEPDLIALPLLANAHDHARAFRTSSLGICAVPLEAWLPFLALQPHGDTYTAACAALGRGLAGGSGVIMVHHTRSAGFDKLPDEAEAIGRAARDVGVRIGFAAALRDRNPIVYGDHAAVLAALPPEARSLVSDRMTGATPSPGEQVALIDAVDAALSDGIDAQYGPTGVQWCSDALLSQIAEASERTGRRIHMHCLETVYQRDWADRTHPGGIIRHLDALGLLSPRLTLAHCTHARDDELALLAERGVTIAVNTSSNLHLRSGIAPVARMIALGCRVAIGLDGAALDDDSDALRELRLAHLVHRGRGFRAEGLEAGALFSGATRIGRTSVLGHDADADLSVGNSADMTLIDFARLDEDRILAPGRARNLLLARAVKEHVREIVVGGRTVLKNGRVTGIDHPAAEAAVLDRLRHAMRTSPQWTQALESLAQAVAAHYEPTTCC